MPTDKQMNDIVDTWLESTNDSPHSAPLTVARVMARVPQTRQRRTWWPLFLRGRAAVTTPDASPTVTGSTRSMFSPATLIAGGAVLAVAGALVIGQPFDRSEDPTPAILVPATEAGPLTEARQLHTATPLGDGRVLIIGGQREIGADERAVASVEMWDPASGEFQPAGDLPEARYDHTSTLLDDGRVLVVGGYGNDNAWFDSALLWNPETGESTPAGTLASGRHRHTATLLPDGRVLVVGGYGGDWEWLASAEVWDPATGEFSSSGELAGARWAHDAVLLEDGRVLVVGGAESINPQALAEVWDPETGSFAPAGELAEGRWSHTTTALQDGRVLIAGGGPGGEPWQFDSMEVWDPTTETFSAAGSLTQPRYEHTATLLPDGRVLFAGGSNDIGIELDLETWDPETGQVSEGGSIAVEQVNPTANLLPDGRVLLTGGHDGGAVPVIAAELIDPTAAIE